MSPHTSVIPVGRQASAGSGIPGLIGGLVDTGEIFYDAELNLLWTTDGAVIKSVAPALGGVFETRATMAKPAYGPLKKLASGKLLALTRDGSYQNYSSDLVEIPRSASGPVAITEHAHSLNTESMKATLEVVGSNVYTVEGAYGAEVMNKLDAGFSVVGTFTPTAYVSLGMVHWSAALGKLVGTGSVDARRHHIVDPTTMTEDALYTGPGYAPHTGKAAIANTYIYGVGTDGAGNWYFVENSLTENAQRSVFVVSNAEVSDLVVNAAGTKALVPYILPSGDLHVAIVSITPSAIAVEATSFVIATNGFAHGGGFSCCLDADGYLWVRLYEACVFTAIKM